METEALSPRWVNVILQITSRIQRDKQQLLISHELETFRLTCSIILNELLLGVVSFPLYLVQGRSILPGIGAQQFRIRKVLSIAVLVVIMILWIAKLSLVYLRAGLWHDRNSLAIRTVHQEDATTNLEQHILDIQQSELSPDIPAPTVSQATLSAQGRIEIAGTAARDTTAVLYVSRSANNQTPSATVAVAAPVEQDGRYAAVPDAAQFLLVPGEYIIRAVALDSTSGTFSQPSDAVAFTINNSHLTESYFLSRVDTWLNIAMVAFIIFGVVSTLLLT